MGRAEAFASKNPVLDSAADGLFTGLGFAWALTLLGVIREVLGSGRIFGMELWSFRIEFFTSAAGAFFTYGVMIALFNALFAKIDNVKKRKEFYAAYPDTQPQKLETKTEEVK